MADGVNTGRGEADDLAHVVGGAYHLPDLWLRRLPHGAATLNYQGRATGRRVFVKHYPPGADLAAERAAIDLSRFAGRAGVPTPAVLPARDGSPIHRTPGGGAVSVWEWVDGQWSGAPGMTAAQMGTVGVVTGRLHRILATHPASSPHPQTAQQWCHPQRCAHELRALLAVVAGTAHPDAFTVWAGEVLRWRLALLPRIAALLAGLPPLRSQVLHGDLAAPNVLWRGANLAALIDFRPPRARPVCWELGRIGCDPRTVPREDWPDGVAALVANYHAECPETPTADLRALVPAWVCYTAASVYPFGDLLTGTPLLPDDLRAYAKARQQALTTVLDNLPALDERVQAVLAA